MLLTIYRILIPIILAASLPNFFWKMYRRGGLNQSVWQRFGVYPQKCTSNTHYVQAVSVGETFVALKFIRSLLEKEPMLKVTLGVGTATAYQLATNLCNERTQVIYAPIDLNFIVQRFFKKFKPIQITLIEGELWPNFLYAANSQQLPIALVNARLSPRSASRYKKHPAVAHFLFDKLSWIGIPTHEEFKLWSSLSLTCPNLEITGNLKYDDDFKSNHCNLEFCKILEAMGQHRPVVLLASTHAGEEKALLEILARLMNPPRLVVVPRHAERRNEIVKDLKSIGLKPYLRTKGELPDASPQSCYIADTTGELRGWTALSDLVIIGKSYLSEGGQNPTEALLQGIPVICGPNMQNFSALMQSLKNCDGIQICPLSQLEETLIKWQKNPEHFKQQAQRAKLELESHLGSASRSAQATLRLLKPSQISL